MTTARTSASKRPRPGRPPGSTSQATRARILAAARACFARAGYASTTNKQIADQAGLTAAAIYQYFDSKTALYLATVRDANEALIERYRFAIADATSMRQALRAVLAASAWLHERDPSLSAFLSALPVEMQRHEELAQAMKQEPSEIVRIIDEVVERGVRTGEVPAALHARLVSTFVACSLGISLYGAAIDGSELTTLADTFGALIDGTLFPPAAAYPPALDRKGRRRGK
jgi:AcrR family transcriptional regulator